MLLYCKEFVSDPALQTLKEAAKGCDIKQQHEMARMVREASKKVGRALTEDELAVAVNNWRENGSIKKAAQAAYEWFRNVSTQWAGQSFQNILQRILERYGITTEEFNHLRLKKVENLNDREALLMKVIRKALPKGDQNTYFQKVLPAEDIPKYLGEDGYSAIQGFIAKYDDVSHIKGYGDVVESFRLDYVVDGKRPFPEGGDTYGYIKFKTDNVENIEIPFGKKMGGTNTNAPPCTLNGFTGARNGEIIAEWYVDGNNRLTPIVGAELHKVVNGVDTTIAIFREGHFKELN